MLNFDRLMNSKNALYYPFNQIPLNQIPLILIPSICKTYRHA